MIKHRLKTAAGDLVLMHRDVRIAGAAGSCAFPGGENGRAGAFARSIFQRYGYGAGRRQRPERIFRLLRFLQNTFSEHRHLSHVINRHIRHSLIVRPCFELNQINRNETPHGKVQSICPQTIKTVVLSNDGIKASAVSETERKLLRLTHAQSIVQRVTKRNIRIEENRFQKTTQRTFGLAKPEYLKQAPFVARERRKSIEEIAREVSVREPSDNSLQYPSNLPSTRGQKDASREKNSVNIEGLTDQIVRAIDQRIIAQRERMGRS